jgi:hypothetical protein
MRLLVSIGYSLLTVRDKTSESGEATFSCRELAWFAVRTLIATERHNKGSAPLHNSGASLHALKAPSPLEMNATKL